MLIILFLYFLPAILGRNHRQSNSITILNLLLGWTVLGWIGALVWAMSNDKPQAVVARAAAVPRSVADELSKLQGLREAGALSDAEFQREKDRLLSRTA
ncbi:hypothetical protein GCM10022406_25930 [Hymenobacter algoricola]|uniref:SHOCT domain-containing protein n=2 Tax=Hymenobacter algoricola TaxID=486267 RepID=A0ABP7N9P0_9BACT